MIVDGTAVAELHDDEFFGEVAAFDWGAGFARARSATVVARNDALLRVLTPDALAQLLSAAPHLACELRLLAHDRLRHAR